MNSFSLINVGLFKWFISYLVSCGSLYCLRNWSMSSKLSQPDGDVGYHSALGLPWEHHTRELECLVAAQEVEVRAAPQPGWQELCQASVFLWGWLQWNSSCLNGFCSARLPLSWCFGQRFINLLIFNWKKIFAHLWRFQVTTCPPTILGHKKQHTDHILTIVLVCSYLSYFIPPFQDKLFNSKLSLTYNQVQKYPAIATRDGNRSSLKNLEDLKTIPAASPQVW